MTCPRLSSRARALLAAVAGGRGDIGGLGEEESGIGGSGGEGTREEGEGGRRGEGLLSFASVCLSKKANAFFACILYKYGNFNGGLL